MDSHKKRIFGYDLLRAIAIIMVMVDHACREDMDNTVHEVIRSILAPDAVLFFMISGALLLPVKGSWGGFVKHRLKRVMIPMIFWSCLYALVLYLQGRFSLSWTFHVVEYSWLIPAVPTYWFIFIISSLYLFMPIISPWLERATKRQLEYFLVLWLAGGLGPWLTLFTINYSQEWNTFYMFTTYFGYCIAGFYLSRYPLNLKEKLRSTLIIGGGLLIGVAFPLWVCYHPGNQPDVDSLVSNNFSITTYLWGFLIFALCMKVKTLGRIGNFIVNLYSRNAFGIYLCHTPLVWCVIVVYFPEISRSTPAMIGILLTVPLIISELTRRIPWIGSKN